MSTTSATPPKLHLAYINTASIFKNVTHDPVGAKHLMVLHETVSKDHAGIADIMGVARDLAEKGYGIMGMTDEEGHKAWSVGLGRKTLYHAGGVNEVANGIEQVSWVPYLLKKKAITKEQAWHMWLKREAQLEATAKLLAAWHNSDKKNHPLEFVDGSGKHKGVTSHWNVSKLHPESQGHTDCWPHHLGGYYPMLLVLDKAKAYANQGYVF